MKKIICLLLFMRCAVLFGEEIIIRYPHYAARSTTVFSIDSILLRPDLTRVFLSCNSFVNDNFTISENVSLEDVANHKEWKATDIDGAYFGQRFQIPESGQTQITLDFPGIPTSTQQIDLNDKKGSLPFHMIDIALQPTHRKSITENAIPTFSQQEKNIILKTDSATICGQIVGYHPRLQWKNGMINLDNCITKQNEQLYIPIQDDGSFTLSLPLNYPIQQTIFFPTGYVNFYIEPGDTLYIKTYLDELTRRVRNAEEIENLAQKQTYYGASAKINTELKELRKSYQLNVQEFVQDVRTLSPSAFMHKQYNMYNERIKDFNERTKQYSFSPRTKELTELNLCYAYGRYLLDYELFHKTNKEKTDSISRNYYTFLQELPLNNPLSLSAADYKLFIARLETLQPFKDNSKITAEELILGFEKQHVALSIDEKKMIKELLSTHPNTNAIPNFTQTITEFNRKYRTQQILIRDELMLHRRYNVYTQYLSLTPDFTFQLVYTRQFIPRITNLQRTLSPDEFNLFTQYITSPFLRNILTDINKNKDKILPQTGNSCRL